MRKKEAGSRKKEGVAHLLPSSFFLRPSDWEGRGS
jgi:hypothetical protein